MITRVFFTDFETITFEGNVSGVTEIGDDDEGAILFFSDATVIEATWDFQNNVGRLKILHRGNSLNMIIPAPDRGTTDGRDGEDGPVASEIALFNHDLEWAYGCEAADAEEIG